MMLGSEKRLKVLQQPDSRLVGAVDRSEHLNWIDEIRIGWSHDSRVIAGEQACGLAPHLQRELDLLSQADHASAYALPLVGGDVEDVRSGPGEMQQLVESAHGVTSSVICRSALQARSQQAQGTPFDPMRRSAVVIV
jgi:hypothetical protein